MAAEFGEAKSEALSSLRRVAELADRSGASTLASRLRSERIPRLESEQFHLVVLGEFNHGKTTFVNALLGAEVLPTGVTPTTAVIQHIRWGEQPAVQAVHPDGSRKELALESLQQYVVGGQASAEGIDHLEVRYPSELLSDGVILVDTPGVNDLNEARAEITYGYIPQSDAVLFLLDAGQILKESERAFVAGKLLAASRDKVLFVVNKLDLLSDSEREEALAYAKANLEKLIEGPRVYGLSARSALQREPGASGLGSLVSDLKTFLQQERGRVLLDNALGEGLRTARTLRTSIEVQRHALAMEQDELERRLEALEADLEQSDDKLAERQQHVREAVGGVKAVVREDVEGFARRFAAALPQEIHASEAKDLRQYLAGFIEERFREFAESEAEVISRRLEQVAEEAIAFVAEDARERAQRLQQALGPSAPKLDLDVNTFAYDVGVFALGAFGVTLMALSNVVVGGAMTLAAPVLAWFVRGRMDRRIKAQAAEEAPKVVHDAAQKMAEAFDSRIDEFGERLVEFVTQANEEMTRSIAEVVRHARNARAAGQQQQDEVESHAGMTLAELTETEQQMQGLRNRLWGNGRGGG